MGIILDVSFLYLLNHFSFLYNEVKLILFMSHILELKISYLDLNY